MFFFKEIDPMTHDIQQTIYLICVVHHNDVQNVQTDQCLIH